MLYAISANVIDTNEWGGTKIVQVPSFILNGDLLGIVSEDHAREIAKDIINPLHNPPLRVKVYAVEWRDLD